VRYFAAVFGAGFVLGTLRVIFIVRLVGERAAELAETPVMLAAAFFSARYLVRRFAIPAAASDRIGMGLIALGLMITAEFGLVLWLRGITISQYFETRDPISGTVYYATLLIFAMMPLVVRQRHLND
jgi:hypothetical protein